MKKSKKKISKKFLLLLAIFLILFVFFVIGVLIDKDKKKVVPKTPTETVSLENSYYDPVSTTENIQAGSKISFSKEPSFSPTSRIIQSFESQSEMGIIVPLLPVPETRRFDQGDVHGLEISNKDYIMRIQHLLQVEGSLAFCNKVLTIEAVKDEFPDAITLDTNNKYLYFSFTSPTGAEAIGVRKCHVDEGNAVWILETYFPKEIYNQKYSVIWDEVYDSFTFAR